MVRIAQQGPESVDVEQGIEAAHLEHGASGIAGTCRLLIDRRQHGLDEGIALVAGRCTLEDLCG